jgi:ribosomal protein S25
LSAFYRQSNEVKKWGYYRNCQYSIVIDDLIRKGGDKNLRYYRILTISIIAEELKIAYSTAQRGVQKLEEAEIIKQINSSKRDKIYCATEILRILEEPTKLYID